MSVRVYTYLFLVLLTASCGDKNPPDYSAEIFNPKWMAGTVLADTGVFLLAGEQGSVVRSENGRDWAYAETPGKETLHDIAGDAGVVIAVGEGGTVLRSTDGGRKWSRPAIVTPSGAALSETAFKTVLHDPGGDVWLAAGTRNAVLRSTDGGKNWVLVSYDASERQLEILDLFVERSSGDLLLAAQHGTTGRSTDGGRTWAITRHDMEAPGRYVPHVVGFHQYDDTLIAAADLGRLLISKNGGRDWRLVELPTTGYFTDSAYDPKHDTVVLTTQTGEAAWSADRGERWEISAFPVANWPSDDVPRLSGVVYDGKTQSLLAVGNSGVMAHSADGGKSWRADIFQPAFNMSVTTLLHDPERDLFISAGLGGYIAAAGGLGDQPVEGWQTSRPGIDLYMREVISIPGSNTFVVVGQLGGIWRSEDDGVHWRAVSVDYPHPNQPPHLRDIVVDPQTGALVAAGPAGSIMRSTDAGKSWTPVFQGPIHRGEAFTQILVDEKRGALIACEVLYRSIYRSGDGGATWKKAATIETQGRNLWHGAISQTNDRIVVIGQRGAIAVSADGGDTWAIPDTEIEQDLYGAFADEESGALFAVGKKGVILRSEDGRDWQPVESGTQSTLRRMAIDPESGALLAFGQEGTIVRSTDGGKTWRGTNVPSLEHELRKAVVEPGTDNLIIVGRNGAVLRSTDGGRNWRQLPSHTTQHFRSAGFNPETGTLIAVGDGLVRLTR